MTRCYCDSPFLGGNSCRCTIDERTTGKPLSATAPQTHTADNIGARAGSLVEHTGAHDNGGTPAARPCPGTFSDPGDGYDSAIRWHADFERGDL